MKAISFAERCRACRTSLEELTKESCFVLPVAGGWLVEVAGVRSDTWPWLKGAKAHALHRYWKHKEQARRAS